LGVVVAAVFWAWLWGPVGLILAVPLTVCLVVIGKHLPQLGFLYNLLGEERVITASGRLYQRLLVGDAHTATDIVQRELDARPFVEVCDRVVLPVMQELKRDCISGAINTRQLRDALRILDIACVPVIEDGPSESVTAAAEATAPPVLCVATQNEVDDFAAILLARAIIAAGSPAETASSRTLANEVVGLVRQLRPSTTVVVQVSPISWAHTRHVIKTITRHGLPADMKLIDLEVETVDEDNITGAPDAGAKSNVPAEQASASAATSDPAHHPAVRRERAFGPALRLISELQHMKRPATTDDAEAAPNPRSPQAREGGISPKSPDRRVKPNPA
jgi:hypothetical protein